MGKALTRSDSFHPSVRAALASLALASLVLPSLAFVGLFATTGCSNGGTGPSGVGSGAGASLVSVEYGALVDVYGFRAAPGGGFTSALYQRDVLIGADIVDERDGASRNKRDNEILYDFISANPDNLQPRLLITREIGTQDFASAFDALDTRTRRITPGRFGQDTTQTPFTVVPRNGAIRLNFSADLRIDDSFFYTVDGSGITGIKNSEAVQILRIVGDPNDANPVGDFEVIPVRVVPRGSQLILDPVLLGSEGVRLQVRNQAGGLPASSNQIGANIRIAIATEGPLAIPGIKRDLEAGLTGKNNAAQASIVRDLRSGNVLDDSAEISKGFRRDPVPPRIVGEILMYLERVEEVDAFTQLLTVYKDTVHHRIDAGDAVRVVSADGSAALLAITEVVADPQDRADNKHTLLLVRREAALTAVNPAKMPGYPADRVEREAWLRANAPRSVLITEFESNDGGLGSDDPQYFVRFSPSPIPDANGGSDPTKNISPFAAAIVRFSKPLDLTTVRAQDSFFFATKPLFGPQGEMAIQRYLADSLMDPASFDRNKFMTPHLVVGTRFDEDGSQTTVRLQPPLGFYLDDTLRQPQNEALRTYYLHIIGGLDGIKDLAGNQLDFLANAGRIQDSMLVGFTLDVRELNGQPYFPNNRVANIARRFAALDEDMSPSYFMADEIRQTGGAVNEKSFPLEDLFGAVNYINGRIHARPTARISQVADNLNQQPPPSQDGELRWCPEQMSGEGQVAANSATAIFGQPIQNPLNPYGCRLMTVWREIDLNLSRVDPFDFNLDVEEVHWAPHTTSTIVFDEFDRMSLYLGHSEYRPENCVGASSSLPDAIGNSGLTTRFQGNFAHNLDLRGAPEQAGSLHNPAPHVGYLDHYVVIDATLAFTEPNNVNRFHPLPPLEKPYFVWRDETVLAQGGAAGLSADVNSSARVWEPYIISPFLGGGGRFVTRTLNGALSFNFGRWINSNNYHVRNKQTQETLTGGLVAPIALPLLADFQMYPDEANQPVGRGYIASGANGWQVALAITSSSIPNFRVYSAGGVANGQTRIVAPGSQAWSLASGGINPSNGQATPSGDNTFYWAQYDFLKRQTVVTAGFVDILNPNRVDPAFPIQDPRLGPFYPAGAANVLPLGTVPRFQTLFEPALSTLPGGTEIIPQYRGASIVDPRPWVAIDCNFLFWRNRNQVKPDHLNFPLDPRKAGDAGMRKYSDQFNVNNVARNFWTYPYNEHVTDYVDDPNRLTDAAFLAGYAGPADSFRPNELRYMNWRFIMKNNVDASPPVSPSLESFATVYRFEQN